MSYVFEWNTRLLGWIQIENNHLFFMVYTEICQRFEGYNEISEPFCVMIYCSMFLKKMVGGTMSISVQYMCWWRTLQEVNFVHAKLLSASSTYNMYTPCLISTH